MTVSLRRYWQKLDWAGVALFVASLAVYVYTLAPTVLPSDHGEYQFKLYTMELIHPPGYPLYLLLGRMWMSLIPFGSVAYRANLFSAVCAAMAVWLLYRFLRLFLRARVPALVGAGLLAFSPLFWNYAIIATVYSMNALLFTASLYLWLAAYDRQRSFLWVTFVFGLGLAHHRLIVVSAPAFLLVTLVARRRMLPSLRAWLLAVLTLLLPLSLYGLLIWQGAWPLPALLRHVLISGGAVRYMHGIGAVRVRLTQIVWPWLSQEIGWPLTLLGIGTLVALLWLPNLIRQTRRRYVALLLVGLLFSHLAFYSLVLIEPDEPRYFMPAYALAAAGVGAAVACAQAGLRRWRENADKVMLVALALPAVLAVRQLPEMAQRYDDYYERLARDAFQTVEQDAIIIARWTYAMPLYYYQAIEGWRPDVQVFMPSARVNRDQTVAWIEEGRPVYFRERNFGLDWSDSGYTWVDMNVGGLSRALSQAPEIEHWIPVSDVSIQSVGLSAWPLRQDELTVLRTTWETGLVEEDEATLSVRLVDKYQQVWKQWTAPLSRLLVQTTHTTTQVDLFFVVPPASPPGKYTIELYLSRADTPVASTSISGVPLAVSERSLAPQRLVVGDWVIGPETPPRGLRLLASDWPGRRFSENTVITLPLFWQTIDDNSSITFSLYLSSSEQRWSILQNQLVFEGESPPVGTLLESRHALVFAGLPPGRHRVEAEVGEYVYDLGQIEIEARQRVYRVPSISHPTSSVLGGEIELLGYDLEPESGRMGEELVLTLYWRSLSRPAGDYKVFAHLMDAQGGLVAQRDSLPLGGSVLTSQWSSREIITDRYPIFISSDLAEGIYRLEVGMYRPDLGERLPAVGAEGERWLHDKVVLQQVEIRQ